MINATGPFLLGWIDTLAFGEQSSCSTMRMVRVYVHAVEGGGRRSKAKKVGFILLECLPDGSTLRGMRVSDDYRGQGHSLYLLAIWAVLCAQADCTPATRVINKPLLALALCRLGFRPRKGRGVAAQLTDARRFRDCDIAYARDAGATVRVHTEYVVTPEE